MLTRIKSYYKALPYGYRVKIGKFIWYAKRLDALFFNAMKLFKLSYYTRNSKGKWIVEGNLHNLFKLNRSIGKDIIVFPVIDWSFRIQRPQHLSREIAKKENRVIYLTTAFNYSKTPGFKVESTPEKNLIICRLNLNVKNKNIYEDTLTNGESAFLLEGLNAMKATLNFKHTYSIVNLPFWSDITDKLQDNTVIYDCMDHHAGFENNSTSMLQKEKNLLKSADLVITTAQTLSDKISEERENIVIRNAAEVQYFSQHTGALSYNAKGRKVIGYYGAVAEWFDLELLVWLAKKAPEFDFVIVGNVTIDIEIAKECQNIIFIGEVPYTDLLGYLNSFDVCLIPFKIIELTICTNPVKVYEYLAAGKPVVATAMPEVEILDSYVHIGYTKEEFLTKIHAAILESSDGELSLLRQKFALAHDWSSRADELLSEINKINPSPVKVSLIVLTYNNIHLTKQCLISIEENTIYDNYEVIVVDNFSNDGTRVYLAETYRDNPRFKIILNDANLGFAAGNNVGLKAASGDVLVIINNDTYVSKNWLSPIVSALEDKSVGLVCPVTNNIGNEAKINISYANFDEMMISASHYTSKNIGKYHRMNCVAFFCVAMRRDVYEIVGPMSEEYGLGFFEDDDYSMRVIKEGFINYAVEGSFVHHHLSASFNKLKDNKKEELMNKNKAIFEKKWGTWKPHSYRKGVY